MGVLRREGDWLANCGDAWPPRVASTGGRKLRLPRMRVAHILRTLALITEHSVTDRDSEPAPGSTLDARHTAAPLAWTRIRAGSGSLRLGPSLLLLAALACSRPPSAPEGPRPGESVAFEGTLSASGERHTLHLGPAHRASVVVLSGSLVLSVEGGLGRGFQVEAIAFADSQTGGEGRFVWTDARGDQIFGKLKGDTIAPGRHILGTIEGGTGGYSGLEGEYDFEWMFVVDAEEGRIQGRATGLKGRVHRVVAPAGHPPTGER